MDVHVFVKSATIRKGLLAGGTLEGGTGGWFGLRGLSDSVAIVVVERFVTGLILDSANCKPVFIKEIAGKILALL